MKESTRNMLVGVFVMASLGALAVMMVWFGETPDWLRRNEWDLTISGVRDLRGIGDGSPVKLNGVEIGRVSSLDFRDREHPEQGVVIIAGIEKQYSIPQGAYAKVYGATLGFGSGHINIIMAEGVDSSPIPTDNAQIRGEMASMIGEIVTKDMVDSVQRAIDNAGDFLAAARPVAENLDNLLESRPIKELDAGTLDPQDQQANVTTVVERIDNLVAHLNAVLGDVQVQDDVKGVVRDLKDTSEDLKQYVAMLRFKTEKLVDSADTVVGRTGDNLDGSFKLLNDVFESAGDAAKSIASVAQGLKEGKGTAGLIAGDERLYEAAVLTLLRFEEALSTLNRILTKIDEEGRITIAQETAVGTFPKTFPVGTPANRQP